MQLQVSTSFTSRNSDMAGGYTSWDDVSMMLNRVISPRQELVTLPGAEGMLFSLCFFFNMFSIVILVVE